MISYTMYTSLQLGTAPVHGWESGTASCATVGTRAMPACSQPHKLPPGHQAVSSMS